MAGRLRASTTLRGADVSSHPTSTRTRRSSAWSAVAVGLLLGYGLFLGWSTPRGLAITAPPIGIALLAVVALTLVTGRSRFKLIAIGLLTLVLAIVVIGSVTT